MRFRLPEGCAGVTLAGAELTPGQDRTGKHRTIEAEAASAADLAPHGIVPVDQHKPAGSPADDPRMLR